MTSGSMPPPNSEPTAGQLAYYLFGNPMDPKDVGMIGRLDNRAATLEKRVNTLIKIGYAIMLLFIAAVFGLLADLFVLISHNSPPFP